MKLKQKIIFFLLFFSLHLASQEKTFSIAYVDSLIASASNDNLYYFQSIKISKKALNAAKAIKYQKGEFLALKKIGVTYLNENKYDEALNHFFEALKIGETLDSLKFQANTSYYIGEIYNQLNDDEKALKNYKEALQVFQKLDEPLWLGRTLNGLGSVYGKQGESDDAILAFKECLTIFEKNNFETESITPTGNLGEYYLKAGKTELAESYFYRCADLLKKYPNPRALAANDIRLGEIRKQQNKNLDAENYYKKGLNLAEEKGFDKLIILAKSKLYSFYKMKNNHEQALQYLEEAKILNDSLLNQNLTNKITKLQSSFDEKSAENKLVENEAKIAQLETAKQFNFYATLLAFTALISLIFATYFFHFKNKKKKKQIENQLKTQTTELKNLKKELQNKKQDLTNFALDISRKNAFSQDLFIKLENIANSNIEEKNTAQVKELLEKTSHHLKMNDDMKKIQQNVDIVNQEFFNKLGDRFPDLTANERQLCGFIRLNLSIKDIASIRNISTKSVEMSRYRLRKKMNLEQGEDIAVLLQNL